MALGINLEHPDHNPHIPGTERRHALAAWLAAGAASTTFDAWWSEMTGRCNFDNLRALCGLAWDTAWRLASDHGEGIDADPDLWFAVWWETNTWTWTPPTEMTKDVREALGLPGQRLSIAEGCRRCGRTKHEHAADVPDEDGTEICNQFLPSGHPAKDGV